MSQLKEIPKNASEKTLPLTSRKIYFPPQLTILDTDTIAGAGGFNSDGFQTGS